MKVSCLCLYLATIVTVKALAAKNDRKFSQEETLRQRGYDYVIGTDEVGRGAIAGPVLSSSCCIFVKDLKSPLDPIPGVRDSKQLSDLEREHIYQHILDHSSIYKWNCAQRSPLEIDESNILKATMMCFQESIQNLVLSQSIPLDSAYSIVDGKSTPKLVNGPTPIPCRPMVDADSKVYTVSLASIIAKVTRDKIMKEAHEMYPEYNFHINKGYRTRDHVERIHKYGPCPLHRMSFKALKHR